MKNLKDNIWIDGFDSFRAHEEAIVYFLRISENDNPEIVYSGKTSDIPEDIAKECVKEISLSTGIFYVNYIKMNALKIIEEKRGASHNILVTQPMLKSAKESIQSVCNQEYCIIFKK